MSTYISGYPLAANDVAIDARALYRYARAHPGPEFVKRRGAVVLTAATREPTLELFERFGLLGAGNAEPEVQNLTWAWLAGTVATALQVHGTADFGYAVRDHYPAVFTAYIEALASGNTADAKAAAKSMGVSNGVPLDHPMAAVLTQ